MYFLKFLYTKCLFRHFCLTKKSDTVYDDSNITKKGLSLKMNTIKQLKKKKIFIDYSTNRGRKDNLFDDDLGVDLQSLYDIWRKEKLTNN